MAPLISIIIPVYNHAHTLKRSFDCIIKQTYRPLEVIIVNDGSTDFFGATIAQIRQELHEYGKNDVSLTVVEQEKMGAAAARNRGFREAKGEYVIFWDADTMARPEMLQRLEKLLAAHPEASYAYSQFRFGWKKFRCQQFNAGDLKRYNYIDTTSLIRREALSSNSGPFDESLNRFQDWDLWLTLMEQGKTGVFVPEVLFRKIVGGRKGMSTWMPRLLYRIFQDSRVVREYQEAKRIIDEKHAVN